jgi:hypothetical protein
MADDWRVRASGFEDAQNALNRLAALMLDLRPFWPKLVPIFIRWMSEQFRTEGQFFGTPWQPLSPRYAAWKAARFPGKSILIAEGDLRRGASLPRREMTPTRLTLTIDWVKRGTVLEPGWHHFGEGHNPRRPLLSDQLPPEAVLEVRRAAEEYAEEIVRVVGLDR